MRVRAVIVCAALLALPGCAALQQVGETLNLGRLQFKLQGVVPGSLAGVDLARVAQPSMLSVQDGIKLASAFAQKSLPLSWTIQVAARNPNDGTDGRPSRAALLSALAWTLAIDGKETVSGDIPQPLEIPGTGQSTIIPLQVSLNLYSFFGERGYNQLLDLALAIAGQRGTASRLTLAATPTVSIGGIPIRYPGQITIVDREFTNP